MFTEVTSITYIFLISVNAVIADSCSVISRESWGAKPPIKSVPNTTVPRKVVYLHYRKSPACDTEESCINLLQSIQKTEEKEYSFPDISFNFWIGNDGRAYEGAGWKNIGRYAYGAPSLEHLVVAYGGPDKNSADTLKAAKTFLDCGVKLGELDEEYEVRNHVDSSRVN